MALTNIGETQVRYIETEHGGAKLPGLAFHFPTKDEADAFFASLHAYVSAAGEKGSSIAFVGRGPIFDVEAIFRSLDAELKTAVNGVSPDVLRSLLDGLAQSRVYVLLASFGKPADLLDPAQYHLLLSEVTVDGRRIRGTGSVMDWSRILAGDGSN